MIKTRILRWLLICVATFLVTSAAIFHLVFDLPWVVSLEDALAIFVGMRVHSNPIVSERTAAAVLIGVLYFTAFMLRIFLIVYWAAYIAVRSRERDELRMLRRNLERQAFHENQGTRGPTAGNLN